MWQEESYRKKKIGKKTQERVLKTKGGSHPQLKDPESTRRHKEKYKMKTDQLKNGRGWISSEVHPHSCATQTSQILGSRAWMVMSARSRGDDLGEANQKPLGQQQVSLALAGVKVL